MYGFHGPLDNCTCPAGYTLVPGTGGAAPTCEPQDPTWAPAVPRCASGPQEPTDESEVSGKVMLALGLGALVLVAVLAR